MLLGLLCLTLVCLAFAGARAIVRNGDVFVISANGQQLQVTSSGSDSQPDLSADGSKVVFVRKVGEGAGEIWLADVGSKAPPRPLVKAPLVIKGAKFDDLYAPRFSPDGADVYFLIPYSATGEAIIKVNIARPYPQFLTGALGFTVVPAGKFKGYLVAQLRKAKLAVGYYDWYYLLTPEGKEVGVVGQDEGDVELFLEMYAESP